MKNYRDQLREALLEMNQIQIALKKNIKAGYKPSEEYTQWINDKLEIIKKLQTLC